MKDAFEINTTSTCGPSPRGSLHAAVSVDLNRNIGFEVSEGPVAYPTMPEPVLIAPVPSGPVQLPPLSAPLKPKPLVSFIISTYNRKDVLLNTLAQVEKCGLKTEEFETIVVDNASTDDTSAALREQYPMIHLLRQELNTGPVSKNLAIRSARGRYIVFLDDDSFPLPGSVSRMMKHFEAEPRLGAAVFTVSLPNGAQECSAYPNVFIGCGTGFRRTALEQVGGLPEDFFMQAEEYDLSLRLLAQGYEIRAFDDIHVTHLKTMVTRASARVTALDVRNNLVLITRYFPKRWVIPFAKDWLRRYRLIALAKGHAWAYYKGLFAGLWRTLKPSNRRAVDATTFEKLVKLNEIELRMIRAVQEHNLRRVLFVDFGKNILPYYLAARKCGLEIVGISDQMLGGRGGRYRKIPIEKDETARGMAFDAAIVTNLSPVHAAQRRAVWRRIEGATLRADEAGLQERPVIDLFEDGRYASVTFADRASRGFHQTVAQSA